LEAHFNTCEKNANDKDKSIYGSLRTVFEFGSYKEPTPGAAAASSKTTTSGTTDPPATSTTPVTTPPVSETNQAPENVQKSENDAVPQKNNDVEKAPEQVPNTGS
jgi:hypothetical protein